MCRGDEQLSVPCVSPILAAGEAGFKGRFVLENSVNMDCDEEDGRDGCAVVSFDGHSTGEMYIGSRV